MGLNPNTTFQSIKTYLKTLVTYKVLTAEMLPTESLELDSKGKPKPYIVVNFGGPVRAARDRGLVSAKYDATVLFITLDVFAGTSDDALAIKGYLLEELVGWKPTGATELIPMGGMTHSRAATGVRPTQYIESLSFQCFSNLEV